MGETYREVKERLERLKGDPAVRRMLEFSRAFEALEARLAAADGAAPAAAEVVQALGSMESACVEVAAFPSRACEALINLKDAPGGTCTEGIPA